MTNCGADFKTGEALPNVQAESKYLAGFVQLHGIKAEGEKDTQPIQFERIRERIKKRHGGSSGYKAVRAHHRRKLGIADDDEA